MFCSCPEFPVTWETLSCGKRETMTMIEVQEGTEEYAHTIKEFQESLPKRKIKFSIEKVQRIENMTEYCKHVALQEALSVKHKKEPLVRRLFHGSRKGSLQPIAVQGFNRNFAADANGNLVYCM